MQVNSQNNTIMYSTISNCGSQSASNGKGVSLFCFSFSLIIYCRSLSETKAYIGTSGGNDASNYNLFYGNVFGPGIFAEAIDSREGTTGLSLPLSSLPLSSPPHPLTKIINRNPDHQQLLQRD